MNRTKTFRLYREFRLAHRGCTSTQLTVSSSEGERSTGKALGRESERKQAAREIACVCGGEHRRGEKVRSSENIYICVCLPAKTM